MKSVLFAICFLILIGYLAGNGSPSKSSQHYAQSSQRAASSMQDIYDKVVDDAESQYQIARSSGSQVDICVQAGMVAAAYLQAQDQPGYSRWKMIEKRDCDR